MSKTIKYSKVIKLNDVDFRRVVGVKKETFKSMTKVIGRHYRAKKSKGGTKRSLGINDEVLLMLEYYREYRTFKHIGVDYGVSESTANYIVRKIEKILIKDPQFHLESLNKTVPVNSNNDYVAVVDVTESECERPKKSKKETTREKRKNILKKHN